MQFRRLGQQREDGSGYGSEAFGEGGSDEETRAEVGLTIGKGRPCVLAANILGTLLIVLEFINLHFDTSSRDSIERTVCDLCLCDGFPSLDMNYC